MQTTERLNIVVAGGAGGIGSAICNRLDHDGHRALCLDLKRGPASAACDRITDLTDPLEVEIAFKELFVQFGSIDGLINTTGYYKARTIESFSWEEMAQSHRVNVEAPLRATLAWLKGCGNRGGVVVNIGSAAARLPSRDIAYASSKAALEGLTRALAKSLAPQDISVFCVAPGVVDTAMSQAMPVLRRDEHLERTWLKRPCTPEEVADLVLYLITGKTAFLTGSVIGMSGGLVCT